MEKQPKLHSLFRPNSQNSQNHIDPKSSRDQNYKKRPSLTLINHQRPSETPKTLRDTQRFPQTLQNQRDLRAPIIPKKPKIPPETIRDLQRHSETPTDPKRPQRPHISKEASEAQTPSETIRNPQRLSHRASDTHRDPKIFQNYSQVVTVIFIVNSITLKYFTDIQRI